MASALPPLMSKLIGYQFPIVCHVMLKVRYVLTIHIKQGIKRTLNDNEPEMSENTMQNFIFRQNQI